MARRRFNPSKHLHSHAAHVGKASTPLTDWVRGLLPTPIKGEVTGWFSVWILPTQDALSDPLNLWSGDRPCGASYNLVYQKGSPLGSTASLVVGHYGQRTREDDEQRLLQALTSLFRFGYTVDFEDLPKPPRIAARDLFNVVIRRAGKAPVVLPFFRDEDDPPDYVLVAYPA